jgi:predicted nucleotidyltransferase
MLIVLMGRIQVAEDFVQEIKKKSGNNISFASLYGSVAEGKDNKESDIDILIVVKDDKKNIDNQAHQLVVKFLRQRGEFISPIVLDKSEFKRNKRLKTAYISNVLKGRIIYGA